MLPDVVFNAESHLIALQSYLWLYCLVDSIEQSLQVAWTKNNAEIVQDVPHIRLLNSSDDVSSTFILIVDNFQASDNGVYQCTARNREDFAMGTSINLIG